MSKETFSEKISESMYRKTKAIEYIYPNIFLEHDDNFEIALCLAYMTLSKEKIIDKDIKSKDRLARLTEHVDMSEINKLFTPGFAIEMPNIIFAKENNYLWILDNIRDSIMHGVFDIDEERKCFIINNTQFDRELSAEIPFSWFIAYAKNDILSKKTTDKYTIKGFYYNKNKSNKRNLETKKELVSNILYRVNITGTSFNNKKIKTRIIELFELYSKSDISNEDVEKYRSNIEKEIIKYNEKYLVSFYIAREEIKKVVEKEFPGVTIDIILDNRKYRFINKTLKRLPKNYTDYDLMYNSFNKEASPKGMMLLEYLTNIIEALDNKDIKELSINEGYNERIKLFNFILNGDNIDYNNIKNKNMLLEQNLNILRSICLNVYGLATLVINHETLYNNHFLNEHPSKYNIKACIKRPFIEYVTKRKSLLLKILEIDLRLFEKNEQYSKCQNETGKQKIQSTINALNNVKLTYQNELANLQTITGYEPVLVGDVNYEKKQELENIIRVYFNHFYNAQTIEVKKKIYKIINNLLTKQIEEESKYTFSQCSNMKDVLEIIRNSFSHIGRIRMKKNRGTNTIIKLNDYDNNNEKSGEVNCEYMDLIQVLNAPYNQEEIKR
ncbi:MAG: hypothetical protein E7163_04815 [Firmicutes bacterium]|nr:hypothetical protein [Bacillota bacterium]